MSRDWATLPPQWHGKGVARAVSPEICYPACQAVTSTEAYGNEISTFPTFWILRKPCNLPVLLSFEKLARHLLHVWYKNNNKHCNPE